jgi:glutamyl-tRNA reductase
MVESALEGRRRDDLTLVDLAVPRDVDPQVGELPGVRLYDLDTLQQRLNGNLPTGVGRFRWSKPLSKRK